MLKTGILAMAAGVGSIPRAERRGRGIEPEKRWGRNGGVMKVLICSGEASLFQDQVTCPDIVALHHKLPFITPHAQRERGKVIGRGVHIYIYIYIYIYVCGRKKNLNRTLEIDSPFQTLTVGLLVEFID